MTTTEPPSPRSARFAGATLSGRYRVLHVIDEAAREILFAGDDMAAGDRVTIAILPAGPTPDAAAQDRLQREIAVTQRVAHPSVASGREPGVLPDGSRYFILPDLDRSVSLRRIMAEGSTPLPRATSIVRQIALALEALHGAGIIHRGLAPEHVRVFRGEPSASSVSGVGLDRVVLVGFGSAQLGPGEAAPALDRAAVPYASPEIGSGGPVDGRSDFYALGVLFYEMVTGSRPARGQGQAPSMTSIRSVPVAVDALALRLIADDPGRRVSVAMDVVRALDALSEPPPQSTPLTPSSAPLRASSSAPSIQIMQTSGVGAAAATTGHPSPGGPLLSPGASRARQASLTGSLGGLPREMRLYLIGTAAITAVIVLAIAVRPSWSESESKAPPPRSSAAPARTFLIDSPKAARPDPTAAPQPEAAGARELRTRLEKSARMAQTSAFIADLERLLEIEPQAAEDREIKNAIIEVLMRIMIGDSPHVEPMFKIVQDKMGTAGPDLLYELLTTRGGSRAAKRAEELLRDEAVRSKGSAAMRIAYDLRTAKTCEAKSALYERAGEEGDRRTLGQLFVLSRECGSKDPKLKAALEALRKRYP